MRPDTPQNYEFVTVENVEGEARSFLDIKPWKQFFDLKGRKDLPVSICRNVTLRNINFKCETFFDVKPSDKYKLSNFTFQNLNIQAAKGSIDKSLINRFTLKNVKVNNALVE
jgi:hypothetical protein